jgi:PhzF family phenazine biosynthesis protein
MHLKGQHHTMAQKIYQVDAFTNRPFSGNPAAVCLLDGAAEENWMQNVAAEMNLAETAFLHPEGDGFRLRWFTPQVEVELCGHATLASAHVLWESRRLPGGQEARFYTASGLLTANQIGDWIELDFPAKPGVSAEPPKGLIEALGVEPLAVVRSQFDYLIEVESESAVRSLAPDFSRLASVKTRGVIVTARSESDAFDFVSRFFAPAVGIDEDPVTGSAHCCLAPYWSLLLGKTSFNAYQASRRGGVLQVRLVGDRVRLAGQAVTVLTGELL